MERRHNIREDTEVGQLIGQYVFGAIILLCVALALAAIFGGRKGPK